MVGRIAERKHLSADALFSLVRSSLAKISDHRIGNTELSMTDALKSAFAMFSLKCPSLLQFDKQQRANENLRSIYRIDRVPCDTQMRTIVDPVDPQALRPVFRDVFRQVQRGKALEQFVLFQRLLSAESGWDRLFLVEQDPLPVLHEEGELQWPSDLLPSDARGSAGPSRLERSPAFVSGADHQAGWPDQERL